MMQGVGVPPPPPISSLASKQQLAALLDRIQARLFVARPCVRACVSPVLCPYCLYLSSNPGLYATPFCTHGNTLPSIGPPNPITARQSNTHARGIILSVHGTEHAVFSFRTRHSNTPVKYAWSPDKCTDKAFCFDRARECATGF